jgi:hypothetical protein
MSSLPNVRAAHQSHAEPATITTLAAAQDQFTARFLEFRNHGLAYFRDRGITPELRHEYVANALALAWHHITTLVEERRQTFAGRLFSVRDEDDGYKPKDAFTHASVVHAGLAYDRFVCDSTPIPDAVAFCIDSQAWLDSLPAVQRDRAIDLADGWKGQEAATRWGVCYTHVLRIQRWLELSYRQFMGE